MYKSSWDHNGLMMGRDHVLWCRECQRTKPGNFFISESLCKKCAAKRRLPKENRIVTIGQEIQITQAALDRLKKKAALDVPTTWRDDLAAWMPALCFLGFCVTAYGAILIVPSFRLGLAWYWYLAGIYILPAIVVGLSIWASTKLSAPRQALVDAVVVQYAKEREASITEAEQFYASSEWDVKRASTVKRLGNICAKCKRKIKKESNLTVDHILPRSKYPHLALDDSNLQILCRSCNSAKGNREN